MRLIPKRTNVKMQFFRNIGVIDMIILLVGGLFAFTILMSDLPFHFAFFVLVIVVTFAFVVPVDDEKSYMSIYYAIKYIARYRYYSRTGNSREGAEGPAEAPAGKRKILKGKVPGAAGKNKKTLTIADITPFTGINGPYIEYGSSYYGAVLQIMPVEFRFFPEDRQNNLIDHVYASILRSVGPGETASLVKVDRPMVYDGYIKSENRKLEDLKKAYVHGMFTDDELTERVGIIMDRISQIEEFNMKDKVYIPFHYLAFYHKDREILDEQAVHMIQLMGANDVECRRIQGPDLAIFLKYNYTVDFDEREAYSLKPEQYMDWILPHEIVFSPRMIRYDGLVTHNLRVTRFPTIVGNAWGAGLFNMPGTKVVMKLKPMDRFKSVRQIDRALQELQEQQEQTGKASKQMELSTHIQTLAEVLRLLQGDNEVLFRTDLFVTAYDYEYSADLAKYQADRKNNKKPQPKLKRDIRRKLSEESFRTSDLFLQQFDAYTSSQISANDALSEDASTIHASSVAAAFPYVYKFLNDENGIFIGKSGGVPAFVNFFIRNRERVNSNMVIIGKSGSGKSYATKTVLTHLAAENAKIFILDPENEYSEMAKNFQGKIIDVGTAAQGRLNPFHVITNLSDEEGEGDVTGGEAEGMSLNVHLQFLEEFYRQILPGIDQDALEYLNNLTMQVYELKGIYNDSDFSKLKPEDFPTFDDLYEKLINDVQMTTGEYAKKNLRVLINFISKFAEGGRNANLWNGPATLSTNENFIVFNFQSLLANKNNLIANAQMLLVMKWLDNEVIKNRDFNLKYHANRRIIVVIDEAHVFIDSKYPIALDFMYQLAKRIRKYNGMQVVITQNIKDFVGTEELARKSTAIINASQYSFIFPLAPNDMSDLVKLYEKAGAINESEQEEIVNNGRGRAFLITAPQERTSVDIIAGKDIEKLFSMQ